MEPLVIGVIVVTALAVVALTVSWFVQRHPDDARHHEFTSEDGAGPTGVPYPPGSRPGGPGAEGMAVPDPGDISPGIPGAEDAGDNES
jgi:hypothetical protein